MLQDHSSKWSAAASPGGLIGLLLTILALMALGTSVLSLAGEFEIALSETIVIVLLGVSVFATTLLLYLLVAYVTISYRLEPEHLRIRCGLWSTTIPYEEMESVEPISDVLGEGGLGWVPYWPGYYLGKRTTDAGTVRIVATAPPRRQIAIARSDGEIFAISPERPQLFIEDLARWHQSYFAWLDTQEATASDRPAAVREAPYDSAPDYEEDRQQADFVHAYDYDDVDSTTGVSMAHPPPAPEQPSFGHQQPPDHPETQYPEYSGEPAFQGYEAEQEQDRRPEPSAASFGFQPVSDSADDYTPAHEQPAYQETPQRADDHMSAGAPRESSPEPRPAFGTSMPADQEPAPAVRFGVAPPEVEPSYIPADHAPEQQQPDESEVPTDQFQVWFPEPPADDEQPQTEQPDQQFAEDGTIAAQPVAEQEHHAGQSQPLAPPKPVISPSGTPRREVMQPLTRVERAESPETSPALRPMIHRDPVALGFVAVSLLTGIAMAGYLLIQWDQVPPSLTLHWNADGLPGRVGEAREIWILPLIAGIVLFANIGLAWSIAQFDRFAARLALSSTVIVHIVIWIALLMIL